MPSSASTFPTTQTRFNYDAITPKRRRKAPSGIVKSEDRVLDSVGRQKLSSGLQDVCRNFSLAAFAVRKHLDYVSTFDFHSRTKDRGFDREVEALMEAWQRPNNCDVREQHPFRRLIRIAEARRTIDGDMAFLKLRDGRLQGIESDRIKNPPGSVANGSTSQWVNGVRLNRPGAAREYAIWGRPRGGQAWQFERTVRASNVCFHGYYDPGRFDQTRGISPLAAAYTQFQDVYEGFTYALIKAKVDQLFGVAVYRNSEDAPGELENDGDTGEEKDMWKQKFGDAPVFWDLEPDEKVELITSNNPSEQFQAFTQLVTMVALKALDIPFVFFDEAHTNFFGSRGSWLLYDRSCLAKRNDVQELLRKITVWRYQLWIQDGVLSLPRGRTIGDMIWEWVPRGMPWWDPAKEIKGDVMAVGAALDNPQRICRERGRGDFFDNVDAIAEAQQYAEERGVKLSYTVENGPDQQTAGSPDSDESDREGPRS